MASMPKVPTSSGIESVPARPTSRSWCASEPIRLYGWDSRSEICHGPNEISCGSRPDSRLLQSLRSAPGSSWFGPVKCCTRGEPACRFFALVHDLSDCALASIYCDESKTGPAEVLVAIPADRRSRLREDFAFEFLTFARFLGSLGAGAELQVHDAIESALADPRKSETVVFSISSGLWPQDLDAALSRCVEKVAITLCQWLEESSAAGGTRSSLPAA